MMTSKELEVFKSEDLENINLDTLIEIDDIQINVKEDKTSRIFKFLKSGKNPYVFKHGDVLVKCSFSESGSRIEEHIERYLTNFLQE